MLYILPEWIRHKENREEIGRIINFLEQDFITEEIEREKERQIERLKEMGEDKIYNYLKNY